jgi:hypothetical protein
MMFIPITGKLFPEEIVSTKLEMQGGVGADLF